LKKWWQYQKPKEVDLLSGGARMYIYLSSINPSWNVELNMGNPDTLYYVLKYCIDNYPSDHYWVILDNHGGAYNGVCWDDSWGDHLSIGDLKTTFSSIASYLGRKFDGIYFHACLMSNLEGAVQLSPYVGYIVGFEPSVTMGEFNLDNDVVVNTLVTNPSISPRDFAIELINQAFISEMGDTLIAAVKLSITQDLIDDIDNLATQLMKILIFMEKK